MKHVEYLSLHQFVSRRYYVDNNESCEAIELRDLHGIFEADRTFDGFFVYPEQMVIFDHGMSSTLQIGNAQYEASTQEEFEYLEKVLFQYYIGEYC